MSQHFPSLMTAFILALYKAMLRRVTYHSCRSPVALVLFDAISLQKETQGFYVVFDKDPFSFLNLAKGDHGLSLSKLRYSLTPGGKRDT